MTQNQIAYQNMKIEEAKARETERKNRAYDKRENFLTPYRAAEMEEHVNAMMSGRKKDVTQAIKNVISAGVGLVTGTAGMSK